MRTKGRVWEPGYNTCDVLTCIALGNKSGLRTLKQHHRKHTEACFYRSQQVRVVAFCEILVLLQTHLSIHISCFQSLLPSLETGGSLGFTVQYQNPGLLSFVRNSLITMKPGLRLGSTMLSIIIIPAGKTCLSLSIGLEKQRLRRFAKLT